MTRCRHHHLASLLIDPLNNRDLLIATRFPTWCARHPRKVVWLMHQHRQAYELFGTAYSDFTAHDDHAERLVDEMQGEGAAFWAPRRRQEALQLAGQAKRLGLIDLQSFGDLLSIGVDRLDPRVKR